MWANAQRDRWRPVSIHCLALARGLGTSFLYKCPASRGSSLRQHGLHVAQLTAEVHYNLQQATPFPLKIAPFHGDLDPI